MKKLNIAYVYWLPGTWKVFIFKVKEKKEAQILIIQLVIV